MKNQNNIVESTVKVNDVKDSQIMPLGEAINKLLADKEKKYLVPLRTDDIEILSGESYFSEENEVFGIQLPKILSERNAFFKEYFKLQTFTGRGAKYEVELYSNELFYLMLFHEQNLESIAQSQNYSCSSSDYYYMDWSCKYLDRCEVLINPEVYNSIIDFLKKDKDKREGLGWISMHEGHLDELEQKYSGFKSAFEMFINSGEEVSYKSGSNWFDEFTNYGKGREVAL